MGMRYDEALATLARVPLDEFVAARKRLAAELKAEGDKEGAARLAKVARPALSVWVVNQLWWRANEPFQRLFALAARLRGGDRSVGAAHREQLAQLRARATELLRDSNHAAAEATLRRVAINLAALAASGGFDPDPPGALSADREPPGFESMELASSAGATVHRLDLQRVRRDVAGPSVREDTRARDEAVALTRQRAHTDEARRQAETTRARAADEALRRGEEERRRAEAERKRAEVEARRRAEEERRRAAEESARKQLLRRALEADLAAAKRALAPHLRRVERLRGELGEAEQELAAAQGAIAELERRLAALPREHA